MLLIIGQGDILIKVANNSFYINVIIKGAFYITSVASAKETIKFCRFWKFLASTTRDSNSGIIAGFLYLDIYYLLSL
jgi:hypothetical protein